MSTDHPLKELFYRMNKNATMFYKYLKKIAYRSRGIVRRDKTNDSDVKFNPKERE